MKSCKICVLCLTDLNLILSLKIIKYIQNQAPFNSLRQIRLPENFKLIKYNYDRIMELFV